MSGSRRPPPQRRPGGHGQEEGPCACCATCCTCFSSCTMPKFACCGGGGGGGSGGGGCAWFSGSRVQLWCNILLGLFTFVADVSFVFALGSAGGLNGHFIAGVVFMVAAIGANMATVLRVVCKLFGQQEELRGAMMEHIMSYAAIMALSTTNVEVLNLLVNRAKDTDTYIRVVASTLVATVVQDIPLIAVQISGLAMGAPLVPTVVALAGTAASLALRGSRSWALRLARSELIEVAAAPLAPEYGLVARRGYGQALTHTAYMGVSLWFVVAGYASLDGVLLPSIALAAVLVAGAANFLIASHFLKAKLNDEGSNVVLANAHSAGMLLNVCAFYPEAVVALTRTAAEPNAAVRARAGFVRIMLLAVPLAAVQIVATAGVGVGALWASVPMFASCAYVFMMCFWTAIVWTMLSEPERAQVRAQVQFTGLVSIIAGTAFMAAVGMRCLATGNLCAATANPSSTAAGLLAGGVLIMSGITAALARLLRLGPRRFAGCVAAAGGGWLLLLYGGACVSDGGAATGFNSCSIGGTAGGIVMLAAGAMAVLGLAFVLAVAFRAAEDAAGEDAVTYDDGGGGGAGAGAGVDPVGGAEPLAAAYDDGYGVDEYVEEGDAAGYGHEEEEEGGGHGFSAV